MNEIIAPQRIAREDRGWRLNREINLGSLVASTVLLASALTYVGTIERRIALIERDLTVLHGVDETISKNQANDIGTVQKQLTRIDDKLDRLVDKALAHNGVIK